MPIRLSNGHVLEWIVASGALAFDGKGWPWEWPPRWFGWIDTSLFTVTMKTVTLAPRKGNLRWWKPWECVRHIENGLVNKVGLTNPGFDWWHQKIGTHVDHRKLRLIGSIYGEREEILHMVRGMNDVDLVALQLNVSCPNTGHTLSQAENIIEIVHAAKQESRHPITLKLSVDQDYLSIARGVLGDVEAVEPNSVPWVLVFPCSPSPLLKLEHRVRGGGGGVSGKAAQAYTWHMVEKIRNEISDMPVIASSIWDYEDILHVLDNLGANAVSFGAIHLKLPFGPLLPTQYVRRHTREHK